MGAELGGESIFLGRGGEKACILTLTIPGAGLDNSRFDG
jgi:hypothetical protein